MKRRSPLAVAAFVVLAAGCPRNGGHETRSPASSTRVAGTTDRAAAASQAHSPGSATAHDLALDFDGLDEADEAELADLPSRCDVSAIVETGGSASAASAACARDEEVEREVGANGFRSRAANVQQEARDLDRAGRSEEARATYERAIVLDQSNPDAAASATTLARNHLALLDRAQGNLDAAREHLDWVVATTTDARTLGAAHHNLGLVLLDEGDLDGALASIDHARTLLAAELGAEHAAVATCLHSRGVVLATQDDLEGATTDLEAALAIRNDQLGALHPSTAETLTSLGVVAGRRGVWADALAMHERALGIDTEVLGDQHPTTAVDHAHVGQAMLALGRADDARAQFTAALGILEQTRADDDPERLAVQAWLAATAPADG